MGRGGVAKVQHYVPKFLLRNFGVGKKDHLFVFDKRTGKNFKTAARNVAAESGFYDIQFQEHTLTLEPSLAQLEGKAAAIVGKLLAASNVRALSDDDRAMLAVFFSVQMMRTRAAREQWRHMGNVLAKEIRRIAPDNSQELIEKYVGPEPDKNEETLQSIRLIRSAPQKFALHFLDKAWVLLKTDRRHPFCIGDHPLGMQNANPREFCGNIGLAVDGIEIYFPLDPEYALGMWCPTLEAEMRQGLGKLNSLSPSVSLLDSEFAGRKLYLEQTVSAIDAGHPLRYLPENVTNFNSIQIANAERYVFASSDDFALVRDMLRSNPELRTGRRFSTS